MLELIGLIATTAAAAAGFVQSRAFVRRRLSFVDSVHRTGAAAVAGIAATLLALPVVGLLPLVGTGTAVLFGVGVGAGVAAGARDLRRRLASRW